MPLKLPNYPSVCRLRAQREVGVHFGLRLGAFPQQVMNQEKAEEELVVVQVVEVLWIGRV